MGTASAKQHRASEFLLLAQGAGSHFPKSRELEFVFSVSINRSPLPLLLPSPCKRTTQVLKDAEGERGRERETERGERKKNDLRLTLKCSSSKQTPQSRSLVMQLHPPHKDGKPKAGSALPSGAQAPPTDTVPAQLVAFPLLFPIVMAFILHLAMDFFSLGGWMFSAITSYHTLKWLKTTQIFDFPVLEVRRPRAGSFSQNQCTGSTTFLSEVSRRDSNTLASWSPSSVFTTRNIPAPQPFFHTYASLQTQLGKVPCF